MDPHGEAGTVLVETSVERPLVELVSQALGQAAAGTLTQTEIIAVLSAVKHHLDREAQFDPVVMAVSTMSYSELEATKGLADELLGENAVTFVASRMADRIQVTRSVVVTAIRKLESAGVLESCSLGANGTRLKPLVKELGARLSAAVAPRL